MLPSAQPVGSGIVIRDPNAAPGDARARERETTPAPPSGEVLQKERSALPTSIPDFDFAAVAEGALSHPAHAPRMPADVAVPTRTAVRPREDLPHRLAFLLLVVDGRTSIAEIAAANGLPRDEVLAGFAELIGAGLVRLGA